MAKRPGWPDAIQDSDCLQHACMRKPDVVVLRNEAGIEQVAGQRGSHEDYNFPTKLVAGYQHWQMCAMAGSDAELWFWQ